MKINKALFGISFGILAVVIFIVCFNLQTAQRIVGDVYDFCIAQFGWFFVFTDIICLIFSLWAIFGPYKDVKLGGETAKPTFSTFSWAGMMFTTSCGAWLMVYGFLEPMYCATQPPFQLEPLTTTAYEYGQAYAHFHWGPNAWCIYVPISIAIGYAIYNRNAKSATISAACECAIEKKKWKVGGLVADIFSIFGAVIAPVISIGTGMPLLVALVEDIFEISDAYRVYIQIGILTLWVSIFGTSVVLGLKKGIKRLSNINIIIAFILMAIFGIATGLFKVISEEISTVGLLANNYIRMSTYMDPFGTGSFVRGWSVSYWACYFVYMPLMGVFNAKISKGRKIKEIAFGQLVLCSLGCWVAMATLGNYAMNAHMNGNVNVADYILAGDEAGAIIAIVNQMPFAKVIMVFMLIILFVFLATTMDSSAFAAAEMSVVQEEKDSLAPRWLRIFWSAVAAIIAFVLCQIGGAKAVRSLCNITGLPLAIITYFIIYSIIKMLKEDKN